MPKGASHPAEAWLLLKYLATNTDTLVYMANFVNNVPTTNEAIASPDLALPEQFGTFMEAFGHPECAYRPTTVLGEELEQALVDFAATGRPVTPPTCRPASTRPPSRPRTPWTRRRSRREHGYTTAAGAPGR